MKKNIGYIRVSTREQNEARQREALMKVGILSEDIYMDKMSGKDFDRPQYQKMLERLDSDTVLYIKSIDRLGRTYAELNEQWRIITKEKCADVVVLDMPLINTTQNKDLLGTFISDLILALLSYVAENERINIKERQAEGIAIAKANGVRFGRPKRPLPDNFEEVCKKWREKEVSVSEAARLCNMPQSTFYRKVQEINVRDR